MPVDYQKGKIYTIRCLDDDTLIYVGSTTQPLAVRWGDHKKHSRYQENPTTTIVKLMKDKGEERFYIELYEDFPCERKEQLIKREGEVQRLIATVNKVVAGRTAKEYYEDNKQRILARNRKYDENNKDELAAKAKIYRQKNKARIAQRKKKWHETNKEKIAERWQEYYANNRERLAEKITCDNCGSIICRKALPRHQKTKKCDELSRNKICPIINDE